MQTIQEFKLVKLIGEGGRGETYLAYDTARSQDVVIKKIPVLDESSTAWYLNQEEEHLIELIQHPHIVNHICLIRTSSHAYIVTEYCAGGDLKSYIRQNGPVNESQARIWLYQLLHALNTMENYRVMHRDIRTVNIFLNDDGVKLGEFTYARAVVQEEMTCVGTPLFMSPELLKSDLYSFKSDVWALGIVAYEMLVGEMPFQANTLSELKQAQKQLNCPDTLSLAAQDFLKAALTYQASARPSFQTLLSHELFQGLQNVQPVSEANSAEVLYCKSLERDFARVELEETLQEMTKYWKLSKLAGLAVLYGTLRRFELLFAELEKLRNRFSIEDIAKNPEFADLYFVVQRHIVFESHEFTVRARKLRMSSEPTDESVEEMGRALFAEVSKKAQTASKKYKLVPGVFRMWKLVSVLLPENDEVTRALDRWTKQWSELE